MHKSPPACTVKGTVDITEQSACACEGDSDKTLHERDRLAATLQLVSKITTINETNKTIILAHYVYGRGKIQAFISLFCLPVWGAAQAAYIVNVLAVVDAYVCVRACVYVDIHQHTISSRENGEKVKR